MNSSKLFRKSVYKEECMLNNNYNIWIEAEQWERGCDIYIMTIQM